jgi:hypothetical protein
MDLSSTNKRRPTNVLPAPADGRFALVGIPLRRETLPPFPSFGGEGPERSHDPSSLVTPICHRQTNDSCNAKMLTCASKMATSFHALREVLPRSAFSRPIQRR